MLKTVSSITNAIGALNYKGTWNASTNTPTIVSSVGVKGDYYVVSVGGTTNINGVSNWGVGDWITFNGSVWQRVEGGADLNGVNLSVSGTTTLSGLTASTALALDASKNVVSVTNTGTDNNVLSTSPTITTPRVVTSLNDTNGNEIFGITATASAVNELTVANAATGNNPVILATGSDTNIGITLTPKGTGGVVFPAGAVGTPAITTTGDTNTGIFFPAADNIGFATNGVIRGRWTNDGLCFNADTAAANALDDYEEGTFTPTIVYSGTNTPTYAVQLGRYTKVGRIVQVQIYLSWNENGSTGNVTVGALPFTSVTTNNRAVPSIFSFGLTGLTTTVSVTGFVNSNATTILLCLNDNVGTTLSATYTDNDQDVYATVVYEVA